MDGRVVVFKNATLKNRYDRVYKWLNMNQPFDNIDKEMTNIHITAS